MKNRMRTSKLADRLTRPFLSGLHGPENVRAGGGVLRSAWIRTHDRHLLGGINDREAR